MRPVNLYLSFLGKMYQDQMQLRRICNKNTMASICNNSMPVQPNLIGSYKIAMPSVANTTMVNSHNSQVQATNINSLSFMRVGKMEILLMTILSSHQRIPRSGLVQTASFSLSPKTALGMPSIRVSAFKIQ